LHLQNRYIKCATSEIVDGNDGVICTIQTISKSGCRGFVDDTEDLETSDLTSVFGGLTLGIVEIGRYGNDGMPDGFEIKLSLKKEYTHTSLVCRGIARQSPSF